MRNGGEPLDVRTEESDEHLRLCLAQLGEICCDVRDRAVVLADLDTGAGVLRGRGVAVGRERRSQLSRTPISWHLLQYGRVADFKTVQALPRERTDGGVAAGVPQVVEGFHRDVVVGVPKQRVAIVGQGEKLRRAAATTELTANLALGDLTHSAGGNEPVEVAADRRGREAEARAQRTGALGPTVVQRPCDPVAGAGVVRASSSYCGRGRVGHDHGFHNSNVTYLSPGLHHPLRVGLAWAAWSPHAQAYDRRR